MTGLARRWERGQGHTPVSPSFVHHCRREGPPGPNRLPYSPLAPAPRDGVPEPSYQTWSLIRGRRFVGALDCEGVLHLGVGREGSAWLIDGQGSRELALDAARPEVLRWSSTEAEPVSAMPLESWGVPRAVLTTLRFAVLEPRVGQRIVLVDGFDPPAEGWSLARGTESLLAALALPQPAGKGLRDRLRRLFDPREPEAVGLILDLVSEPPAPSGWCPWLRELERRGLHLDWRGNESDNYPLDLFERAAPEPATRETIEGAMLELARDVLERDTVAWDERDPSAPADPGFRELVPGEPRRGFWRRVEWRELETQLHVSGYAYLDAEEGRRDQLWARRISGPELLVELRARVHEPVAVGVFDVPREDCVEVWYLIGGVARASGALEWVAVSRVWT